MAGITRRATSQALHRLSRPLRLRARAGWLALGLGAGVCFYYVALDGQSPSRFTNGRTSRLEDQFVELTGAPLEL